MRLRVPAVVLVMLTSGATRAQDAGDVAMARGLGTEGLRLAESGNCAAAIEKLARAEKLFHAPTTLERLGECQIAQGHYVEGTENLRRVINEKIPDKAHAAFAAAQTRARSALDAALPHLGKLRVDVSGAAGDVVVLKIDGQPVSSAAIGVDRPIDPGAHVVDASATGYKAASGKVLVGDGASQTVSLTLEREVVTTPVDAHHDEKAIATPKETTRRVYWPAGVAFGVAGAGAIVTGVFGGLATAKKGDLASACTGSSCPASARGVYNDASTFASLTNVGLIVAGVAAAAGIVLFVFAPKHTVVETVGIAASPFGASLSGSF